MKPHMTVGKLAKAAGVNIQAIHYYERRGILAPAARRASGYRLYTDEATRKLCFIKNAQRLGFNLADIAELLRLRPGKGGSAAAVRAKVLDHLTKVRARLAELQSLRGTLRRLIRSCAKGRPNSSILESFERARDV